MWFTTATLVLLSLSHVYAKVELLHRVFHPLLPQQQYIQRAEIEFAFGPADQPVSILSAQSLSDDLLEFARVLEQLPANASTPLYQLALQREGSQSDAQWDVSSVKVCHLSAAVSESLFLHVTNTLSPKPFALDYFVSPVPHDGQCPTSSLSRTLAAPLQAFAESSLNINTTIVLLSPVTPPLPELRTPPPLTPEGEVLKPIPEKSFLQKYWMYIVAIMIALVFSGGAEEERPRQAAQ